ncbi:hypothetical protein NQ317_011590 [Molorchus minor]|uniref:Lipoyl-binding domain-containing protein n=1 Tax=Molorchus minor TaxID=1323400 RepID=A0ABQ9IXL5_9CUCU|nr:hypothetical protein NQ317_011590 [Molorchus minor]
MTDIVKSGGPVNPKAIYQGSRILRKYSVSVSTHNGTLVRVPNVSQLFYRAQKSTPNQNTRYIQTTSTLFESQVVKTPSFPESVTEGDVRLDKKVGDHVATDEVVMEIETDKTAMPVHSPGNGIIEEILVKDGDTVKAGIPLFKIKITGEAPAAKAAPAKEAASPPPPPPKAEPKAAPPRLQHQLLQRNEALLF